MTRWTAVQGKAFDAKTTRLRGQRAASSSAYSRARARSASSDTTSTGVPTSVAMSSSRHPATSVIPSASGVVPAGNRSWMSRSTPFEHGQRVRRGAIASLRR